jgi:hypothetical protein
MNRLGHLIVGHGGAGGGHVRDQVREHQVRAALAMLAPMPVPAGVPPGALSCSGVL